MIFTMNQELILRVSAFVIVLILMFIWESLTPLRPRSSSTRLRQVNNLFLVFLNTAVLRIFLPLAAVSAAAIAGIHGWGLFNYLSINNWLAGIVSFLILDIVIYCQHRIFHSLPLLWRLHRVHHSDTEVDVSTGVRFHTIEIILSMLVKIATVIALGAPVVSVIFLKLCLAPVLCSIMETYEFLPLWIGVFDIW